MKWCAIVFVLTIFYCVSNGGGLKILKKLKDLLHPTTVPTTTIVPTLPQYEKQPYSGEDSKSWEQESSTSKTKTESSKEDVSTSQSSENDRDKFAIPEKNYNNIKPDKTTPLNGNDFNSNSPTTSNNDDDSKYNDNKDRQFSTHNKFNHKKFQTTTEIYDHSNSGNYPGQTSIQDSINNQGFQTTTKTYDQGNNENSGSFNNQVIKPNSPTSNNFNNQIHPNNSFEGFDSQITQNTPPTVYENTNYNEVQPGIPSKNDNNDSPFFSTSTSVAPDMYSGSSVQEENQIKYTSGQKPSSTAKGTNQNYNNGGNIVFPDDPSLDSNYDVQTTPAPVSGNDGRRILDGPLKDCGPGQVYDKNKNVCKELARK